MREKIKNTDILRRAINYSLKRTLKVDLEDVRAYNSLISPQKLNRSELLTHVHEVFKAKNKDYGDSFQLSCQKYGLIAAKVRISDKLSRLENLKNSKNLSVASETILDTILDAINYSLMTTLYMSHGFLGTESLIRRHKELCCSYLEPKEVVDYMIAFEAGDYNILTNSLIGEYYRVMER